jgi:4-hydroxybenzoate polyprenyltransferase
MPVKLVATMVESIRAFFSKLYLWGSFIKFSHSVFALPFAGVMLAAIAKTRVVTISQLLLLISCVVFARSAAMAFNRVVDLRFDSMNKRTVKREIPSGKLSIGEGYLLVFLSGSAFIASSFALGIHCGILSPIVLGLVLGYSLFKRFSSLSHLVLGLSLACAPGGVWYALEATWSWRPVPLMACVVLWVAGFDVLYACQDIDFDRGNKLYSIPAAIGVKGARIVAFVMHILSVCFLSVFGAWFSFGIVFWICVSAFILLVFSQHLTVMRRGIGVIDQVFFERNGLASIVLFLGAVVDILVLA